MNGRTPEAIGMEPDSPSSRAEVEAARAPRRAKGTRKRRRRRAVVSLTPDRTVVSLTPDRTVRKYCRCAEATTETRHAADRT